MQDHIRQIDENLLRRTAGPYIRVKTGNSRTEQCFPVCPRKRTSDLRVNEYTP
jgi:hypothetical protein